MSPRSPPLAQPARLRTSTTSRVATRHAHKNQRLCISPRATKQRHSPGEQQQQQQQQQPCVVANSTVLYYRR